MLSFLSLLQENNSKQPVAVLLPQTLQPIAEDEGQFRAMEVAQTNPPGQAIAEVKDIEKGWKT